MRGYCRNQARTAGVDRDDCFQEVMLTFYSPAFQGRLAGVPAADRAGYVMGMAKRAVAAYVGVELKAGALLDALDTTQLTREKVDALLSAVLNGRSLTAAEAGHAEFIAAALADLSASELELLRCPIQGLPDLAEARDGDPKALGQRRRRLLDRITRSVNTARQRAAREHAGPGSRQAQSNASALRRTD